MKSSNWPKPGIVYLSNMNTGEPLLFYYPGLPLAPVAPLTPFMSNVANGSFAIGVAGPKLKRKKPIKKSRVSKNKYNFVIYNGPRWKIPSRFNVSESIRFKFSWFETIFSFRAIKIRIRRKIEEETKFVFKASPRMSPFEQSYYAKQENEWNKVVYIYSKLFKMQKIMKAFLFRWRIRICLNNLKNTEDPVTMETPKRPIYVFDMKQRISFLYDARTLRKTIENRILLSDYMFSEPKKPVNLLTNTPFSYGQLISIIRQCKKYGEFSWILEDLYKYRCDLSLLIAHNKQKLKIEAINAYFKKSPESIRETVLDLFNLEAEHAHIPHSNICRFEDLYDDNPKSPIIQQWIKATREYYVYAELQHSPLISRNSTEIDEIMEKVYRLT